MDADYVAGGFFIFMILMSILMVAFAGCVIAFWIWALVDCLNNTPSEDNQKLIWVLIIIFTHWIGALIYLVVQRPKNLQAQEDTPD